MTSWETLRASGINSGGPPLNAQDRKVFADHLDRILSRQGPQSEYPPTGSIVHVLRPGIGFAVGGAAVLPPPGLSGGTARGAE